MTKPKMKSKESGLRIEAFRYASKPFPAFTALAVHTGQQTDFVALEAWIKAQGFECELRQGVLALHDNIKLTPNGKLSPTLTRGQTVYIAGDRIYRTDTKHFRNLYSKEVTNGESETSQPEISSEENSVEDTGSINPA